MLTFTPKTDEELNMQNLLEPGEGEFELLDAVSKISKSGNAMLELKLRVWDRKGKEKLIFDYLVNVPELDYKIKHFCEAIGLEHKYKAGSLSVNDLTSSSSKKGGRLKIGIQKDFRGMYPDKNKVVDYIKSKTNEADADYPFNDQVPF